MATHAGMRPGTSAAARQRVPLWLRDLRHDWPIHLFLLFGLFISLLPVLFMLMISVKSQGQYVTQPLGISYPLHWENYRIAFNVLKRSFLNSLFLVVVNVSGTLLLASISAYVFARYRFPGREALYWVILSLLFIPGILTFAPTVQIVSRIGLIDSYWVLILPQIAGGQIFSILWLRSFFEGTSEEIMDAARVDGAGVLALFWRIVLPLARPILATMAVLQTIGVWNEWIWALLTIRDPKLRPMALQVFYLASDVGPHVGLQMAGYALATIPLIILFALFSKQFVEGLTSGALKW